MEQVTRSPGRKGPPGRLSRPGPGGAALGSGCGRPDPPPAPRPPATPATPRSRTARAASAPPCPGPARSPARPAASWPGPAATRSLPPEPGISFPLAADPDAAGRAGRAGLTRWGITAASSRQSAVSRSRSCRAGPGGRPAQTERPHPLQAGGRPVNHHVAGRGTAPAGPGKPGCPLAAPRPVLEQVTRSPARTAPRQPRNCRPPVRFPAPAGP